MHTGQEEGGVKRRVNRLQMKTRVTVQQEGKRSSRPRTQHRSASATEATV